MVEFAPNKKNAFFSAELRAHFFFVRVFCVSPHVPTLPVASSATRADYHAIRSGAGNDGFSPIYDSVPFDDGTPVCRGSTATPSRSARADDLNRASAM